MSEPLASEDLIGRYGPEFIHRIEAESRTNPKFRDLLGGVWKSTNSEIWARSKRAWEDVVMPPNHCMQPTPQPVINFACANLSPAGEARALGRIPCLNLPPRPQRLRGDSPCAHAANHFGSSSFSPPLAS